MNKRFAVLVLAATAAMPPGLFAGEWKLSLGDFDLEGISVDESVSSGQYHLGLTGDAVWFMFSFPAADGGAPAVGTGAERVNLNGFEPNIRCTGIGAGGVTLDDGRISGSVTCEMPAGELDLEATFQR